MVWLLFFMLVEEFSNIQLSFNMHESIIFTPAALSNLANLCHPNPCMYVGGYGHVEGGDL